MELFEKNPISFKIIVHLKSSIGLYDDVRLKTKTSMQSITWVEEPKTKLLGMPINLKKMAEKNLLERAPDLVKMVDRIIKEQVHIKAPIEKIWNDLQKSMPVNKQVEVEKAELKLLKDNVQLLFSVGTDFEISLKKEGINPHKKAK